jgi:Protein of unknown function (DUF1264)
MKENPVLSQASSLPRPRPAPLVALACLASAALGALLGATARLTPARADGREAGHRDAPAGDKAPIQEVLHCPLAFAGVHLLKDLPERSAVAYHYCKDLNADISQCVLYDGTGPDARLIGVEYLISDALYRKLPEDERAYWHDHRHEIDSGLLRSLTQSGGEERQTLAKIRTLWGKVYHTWASGNAYPRGPARLFWSVTGEDPFILPPDAELPPQLKMGAAK